MKILGLHVRGHDTGACLMIGDRIRAVAEERLTRVKHSGALPFRSIAYLLRDAGLRDLKEVDLIVVQDHRSLRTGRTFADRLRDELQYRGRIHAITHHDAHAASAFFASGFEDAAILVVDGLGSPVSDVETGKVPHYALPRDELRQREILELQSSYRGTGNRMMPIRKTLSGPEHRNGIGMIYMTASRYLRFGHFGSGKVMGLAPYGKPDGRPIPEFYEDYDGELVVRSRKNFRKHLDLFAQLFYGGHPPRSNQPLPDDAFYTSVAWQVQQSLESVMLTLARQLYDITRAENLCVAGGVGLNCIANKRLLEETPFRRLFVQPGADDSGIPLGCALYGAYVLAGRTDRFTMQTASLGHEYTREEIERAFQARSDIRVTTSPDVVRTAARMLADGKILGWFTGGSEIGPRALGHRSILCDPRRPEMKDVLNSRVKHREGFRPFAPSVLAEYAEEYFDLGTRSPFMLLIAPVRPEKRSIIPAVTHVDGSARVQTVTPEANGRYDALIREFHRLTGVPVLLNTSFNVAGEPIVETPEDAVRCFMGTDMDALVIEDYLVEAAGPKVPLTPRRQRRLRWQEKVRFKLRHPFQPIPQPEVLDDD